MRRLRGAASVTIRTVLRTVWNVLLIFVKPFRRSRFADPLFVCHVIENTAPWWFMKAIIWPSFVRPGPRPAITYPISRTESHCCCVQRYQISSPCSGIVCGPPTTVDRAATRSGPRRLRSGVKPERNASCPVSNFRNGGVHSALMPAARTTGHHFATSAFW